MKVSHDVGDSWGTTLTTQMRISPKIASENTNSMNARSQETPVGDRVDDFLNRMGK